MARPKRYINFQAYRKEYNARPEVKARNKLHNLKWKSKPEVRAKLRVYYREYMKKYWKDNPEKYHTQKKKIAY
jgi:hypothetical protein